MSLSRITRTGLLIFASAFVCAQAPAQDATAPRGGSGNRSEEARYGDEF